MTPIAALPATDWAAIHARLDDVRRRAVALEAERDAIFGAAMSAYELLEVATPGDVEAERAARRALRGVLKRVHEVGAK